MEFFNFFDRLRYGKQAGYEKLFKNQDVKIEGKPGVILADMGMPEDYEYEFYMGYIHHVFEYLLPKPLQKIILADRGLALIDPENPLAREPFTPKQLVDFRGSFVNREGKPYTECTLTWRPPGMKKNPWDNGYFLYTGDGKGGSPDICQKTGAKVIGWYYGSLIPEKKVAWAVQCGKVVEETIKEIKKSHPNVEFEHARYVYSDSMKQSVDSLLLKGCQTIIYASFCNPVYSDFEEYYYGLPMIHHFSAGRAKVICAPQLGDQPAMRQAYLKILEDQLAALPQDASVYVIFSKHGHPFKKESQDTGGIPYRQALEEGARKILQSRSERWGFTWSNDEYADEYYDPKNLKKETHTAYREAIEGGYDYAIEVPTEFMAENTDLMIFHAMKKFNAFASYSMFDPVPYPDWEKPLVRKFHEGKTTGIYAGVPVGPYRKYVVEALTNTLLSILG